MSYLIHFLGKSTKTVNTREDALFHLGAKYGARVHNKAVTEGYIKYTETYAKVIPFEVSEIKDVFSGNKFHKEIILNRL